MEEKKTGYRADYCSGCSNHCHLSSPRCMIGMRHRINIGWKDEPEEKKDDKTA